MAGESVEVKGGLVVTPSYFISLGVLVIPVKK